MMKNNILRALRELCKRESLEGGYMKVGQARQECEATTEKKSRCQMIKLGAFLGDP